MNAIKVANRLAMFNAALLVLMMAMSCSSPEKEKPVEEQASVRAHSEAVQLTTVSDFLQAPGTVKARTATVLSSRTLGQIISLTVHVGDSVRQGQVIAEIENRDAGAQLRRAKAAAEEARHGLEEAEDAIQGGQAAVHAAQANRDLALATKNRYDVLREKRSVSPQEYDEVAARNEAAVQEFERAQQALSAARARRLQALSRIEQADAAMESASAGLEYLRIVSPMDGIVTERRAEIGMLATPGLSLVAMEDPRTYELETVVEESRLPAIRLGQRVQVEVDALAGMPTEGHVREIAPSSDPATRSYLVKVQLSVSGERDLSSGLFGKALFPLGNRQALLVPNSALIRRGQLEGIYVVTGDVAVFRLVNTGKVFEEGVEVLSGISAGARILPAPSPQIFDGARIVDDAPSQERR